MTVVDLHIATLEDAEAIARIHVETWRSTYAGLLPDELLVGMSLEKQTQMWQRMLRGGETVVVAEDPRYGIIGFGSYGPNRSARGGFTGEVYTLYLLPDFQGLGIGQGLLRTLFGALAREGHETALIWVLANNPTRFFYEAMGGKPAAARNTQMGGQTVREVAYGWESVHAVPSARV
ncbi:MAG: GNAT family N-acetyltransferase [Proteobacteria bacterium]|nr:GNAT family N-acetyltransferase [Pseudomonadota bacterium]MCK4869156.1 GNAT family N-acetyltransferase [Alphaproteobacteria bacterium]